MHFDLHFALLPVEHAAPVSSLCWIDLANLDLDVFYDAGASLDVGELCIIDAGFDPGDTQPLVVIDGAVLVVFALIRAGATTNVLSMQGAGGLSPSQTSSRRKAGTLGRAQRIPSGISRVVTMQDQTLTFTPPIYR